MASASLRSAGHSGPSSREDGDERRVQPQDLSRTLTHHKLTTAHCLQSGHVVRIQTLCCSRCTRHGAVLLS